jgi:hypothetical protein
MDDNSAVTASQGVHPLVKKVMESKPPIAELNWARDVSIKGASRGTARNSTAVNQLSR